MDTNGVGWIGAIIIGAIGGLAGRAGHEERHGHLHEHHPRHRRGRRAERDPGAIGFSFGTGLIAYLITGFIGACLLIFIFRAVRGRRV